MDSCELWFWRNRACTMVSSTSNIRGFSVCNIFFKGLGNNLVVLMKGRNTCCYTLRARSKLLARPHSSCPHRVPTMTLQVFRPPEFPSLTIYLDGAHTEQSMHACLQWFVDKVINGRHIAPIVAFRKAAVPFAEGVSILIGDT